MAIKINGKDLQKRIINGKEVEKVILNGVQIWPESTPISDDYLCFTANSMPSVVRFIYTYESDPPRIWYEYSKDKVNWTDYPTGERLLFSSVGDKFYLRCKLDRNVMSSSGVHFTMAGSVSASGDIGFLVSKNSIRSLILPRGDGGTDVITFEGMFAGCDALTTPPKLPATTLSPDAYKEMFLECTNLTVAPELPATAMNTACYMHMFRDCTSLTTPPELPATTLKHYCYEGMFRGCTNLTTAPRLPATTFIGPNGNSTGMQDACYDAMFYGCTNLTTLPALPITDMGWNCYARMFNGCSKIKLSETQAGDYQTPYRIPVTGTGVPSGSQYSDLEEMFLNTGGTFTGTPNLNQTYYTSNQVI